MPPWRQLRRNELHVTDGTRGDDQGPKRNLQTQSKHRREGPTHPPIGGKDPEVQSAPSPHALPRTSFSVLSPLLHEALQAPDSANAVNSTTVGVAGLLPRPHKVSHSFHINLSSPESVSIQDTTQKSEFPFDFFSLHFQLRFLFTFHSFFSPEVKMKLICKQIYKKNIPLC